MDEAEIRRLKREIKRERANRALDRVLRGANAPLVWASDEQLQRLLEEIQQQQRIRARTAACV